AHFAQHAFVEMRNGVNVVRGVEVDGTELVYNFAQDVARADAVVGALKDGADDGADIAVTGTGDKAEVGKQVVIDEVEQLIACQPPRLIFDRGPVPPAVGVSDDRFICLAQFFLLRIFKIVKVLEEDKPGELRQSS